MNRRLWSVVPLVFGSGACALVYQIAWTRDFRLIFGASTAASAAVVAIFIAGLGFGGLVLGRRVEGHPRPLQFYAALEALIAATTALSPLVLWLARKAYIVLGGTPALGLVGGSVARLALAALVIIAPTFLMGGTLPAVACAVENEEDPQRRGVALLYGVNTLGAVLGCVLSNFFLLEGLGTHRTLWLACAINLALAAAARAMSHRLPALAKVAAEEEGPAQVCAAAPALRAGAPSGASVEAQSHTPAAPRNLVLVSAAVVGFAFFLMELVWYRMLGPLLGGTVFTFGLILAIALFGIGAGGALYTVLLSKRPALLRGFAYTCVLEAVCIAVPYACGDRLAVMALMLRPLGAFGFGGHVLGWTVIAGLTIFPAAVVAGVQFPLLIALLGRGRAEVGKQIGQAYAANTIGAIAGAIAGGFGLMPLLSAPGCWRVVAVGLALFGGAVMLLARSPRASLHIAPAGALVCAVFLMAGADGPTAAWRHSSIGAGRVPLGAVRTPSGIQRFLRDSRRAIVWEAEGVESSVALEGKSGFAFVVNGKIDGHAYSDAATQVMGGLIGAAVHPHPEAAMVIGLGTGSTAGWLARIDTIARVDVAELEPAIIEVARRCAAVNEDVLENPKVHLLRGDAREILGVARTRYDLIFSEPSNPYRAGVASLYTQEFYGAVSQHLREGGIFSQWVQSYEVDAQTVRTIFTTLASAFPFVEVWQALDNDLILVASHQPIVKDVAALRERLKKAPFARAMQVAWHTDDLEGFLAHYLARPSLVRAIAAAHGTVNTDDRALIEFGFARSLGRDGNFNVQAILEPARARKESLPEVISGAVDWERMRYERASIATADAQTPVIQPNLSPEYRERLEMQSRYLAQDFKGALVAWRAHPREPSTLLEKSILADAAAQVADPEARHFVDLLRAFAPVEADGVQARILLEEGKLEEAASSLEASLVGYRSDPWPRMAVMALALAASERISAADPRLVGRMMQALDAPFSINLLNDQRLSTRLAVAQRGQGGAECARLLAPYEPWTPWSHELLAYRRDCYVQTHAEGAENAEAELARFLENEALPFAAGLALPR